MRWKTDLLEHKTLCLNCFRLNEKSDTVCQRCGEGIAQRKSHAVKVPFALSLASVFFLVPANLLPIMLAYSVFGEDSDTIFSGVEYFFSTGEYFIALIIFTASICIPFVKIVILNYLFWITKFHKTAHAKRGVKLYKFIQFVGKYSMLDVFVVAIMVSVVQFGGLATIYAGLAALFFTMAVILTIVATEHFDPRLMWSET